MGIADRFFKRSQSAAAAAAAAAMANAKFKIGDEVKDQSTGRFGRVRDIDYDGTNKKLIYTVETPGSGKMNVAEDDLQLNQVQFPPTYKRGDEVQGFDNPVGRGTVLNDSFIAPDGKEWVKVAWPDGTVTYELVDDIEVPNEDDFRTEGTARPLQDYINQHGKDPQVNAPPLAGSYPSWFEDENYQVPTGETQVPSGPTKDELSDRIYDIMMNKQPEQQEGELQRLLDQWQQVTGTPQPRFLGGSKSFGIVNKFRKAQQPSPADQFLQAIQKYIQSGNKLFFKGMTNRVFVEFNKIDENTVELAHIHAEIIGQGDGTLALQGINKLADQYGVQIVALVGAIADVHDSFMGDDELVDWYAQQGYVDTEDFEHLMDETDYRTPMTRKPE